MHIWGDIDFKDHMIVAIHNSVVFLKEKPNGLVKSVSDNVKFQRTTWNGILKGNIP